MTMTTVHPQFVQQDAGAGMLAVVCTRYGTPDALQVQHVAKPVPKAGDVLIKVHAACVTPSDVAFRKGDPFVVRLLYGLARPRLATQGVEFAGEVEAVGPGVTSLAPGDRVFGMSPDRFGAQAEYLCLPEVKPLTTKSPAMSFEEAVSICDGATTALTFLRDQARVQPGQRVLINGASGSVGAYAVQLAKAFGATVAGVCSTANVDRVKSLGADEVIDYTQVDFTKAGRTYDVIFDAVGKSSFSRCSNALSPRGIYLTTVPSLSIALRMLWTSRSRGRKAKFTTAGLLQSRDNLNYLKELFDAGTLRAVIDRRYSLAQIAEAHEYVEGGHKRGTVVVTVGDASAR